MTNEGYHKETFQCEECEFNDTEIVVGMKFGFNANQNIVNFRFNLANI